MSYQIVPKAEMLVGVYSEIEKYRANFAALLPQDWPVERFIYVARKAIQNNPKLAECGPSLLSALMESAQLGLEPNTPVGHCYIIPYGQTAKFIIGYKGYIELMMRSGKVSFVDANVVHEEDKWVYEKGLTPRLEHTPSPEPNPGPIIAAYAIVHLKDGGKPFCWMWKRETDAIKARSASKAGPWVTDEEEMTKKCPIRRVAKLCSLSPELNRAVAVEEQMENGIPIDNSPPEEPEPMKPVIEKLVESIGNNPERKIVQGGIIPPVKKPSPGKGMTIQPPDEEPKEDTPIMASQAALARIDYLAKALVGKNAGVHESQSGLVIKPSPDLRLVLRWPESKEYYRLLEIQTDVEATAVLKWLEAKKG